MPYGTLNAGTITPGSGNTLTINEIVDGTAIKDQDNMSSNSATHLATQQSIKAYVDTAATQATTAAQGVGTGNEVTHSKLTATNGVLFGTDTAAANTLDDYEEGTHTAVAAYTGVGSPTIKTANDQLGYTKIGNLVTVTGYLVMNANGSGGDWSITLPLAVATGPDQSNGSAPSIQISSVDASNAWQGSAWEGESVVYIQEFDGTSNVSGGAKVNDGSSLMISLTYRTA